MVRCVSSSRVPALPLGWGQLWSPARAAPLPAGLCQDTAPKQGSSTLVTLRPSWHLSLWGVSLAAASTVRVVLYGSALYCIIAPMFNPKMQRQHSAAAAWEGRYGQLASRTSTSFGQCLCVTQAEHS